MCCISNTFRQHEEPKALIFLLKKTGYPEDKGEVSKELGKRKPVRRQCQDQSCDFEGIELIPSWFQPD
ncbi:MAG: hypothetical protein RLY30_463 [Pseudomonadota bacterium]